MTPAKLAAPVFFALGLLDLGVLHLRLVPELARDRSAAAVREAAPARAAAIVGAAPPPAAPSAKPTPSATPDAPPASNAAPPRRTGQAMRDIHYGLDLSRIDEPFALVALRGVAAELRADPSLHLVVRGHSDRMGSATHNLMLSHRRAMSVFLYLAGQGAPIERISIEAVGSDEPVDPSSTQAAWAKNRRVQLLWR